MIYMHIYTLYVYVYMFAYVHICTQSHGKKKGGAEVGPQKRFGIPYSRDNSPLYLFDQYQKKDGTDQHFSKN